MSVRRHRINDEKVEVLPIKKTSAKRIAGFDIIPKLYCNIEIIAPPESGKTTTIYNLIKKCATPNTIVIFIVSTIFADDSYLHIVKWLKDNKIQFIIETSFKKKDPQGKEYNQLDRLIKYLKSVNKGSNVWNELLCDSDDSDSEPETKELSIFESSDEEEEEDPPRPRGKKSPDVLIICDDMSKEMRYDASLLSLLKEHRHMKAKVVISTQSITDLPPDAHNMMNYILLFDGIPGDKLEKIHSSANICVDINLFKDIYNDATKSKVKGKKSHNFIYIDTKLRKFRRNFNFEYEISDDGSCFI